MICKSICLHPPTLGRLPPAHPHCRGAAAVPAAVRHQRCKCSVPTLSCAPRQSLGPKACCGQIPHLKQQTDPCQRSSSPLERKLRRALGQCPLHALLTVCPAPTGTEAGEEPWHPAEPRLPPCPVGFLLLHKHLREGGGAAARVCHHRLRHRQHSLHCRVGESSSSLPIASQQLGSSLWSVSGPRGLVTEQQSLLQARGITCSLSALSFHLQQLVKFITGIKQLTLIVREVQRLAQGHSQNAQLSGSRRQLSPLGILCSPQTLPQGRGDPSATPSLQCPVAFPALGGTRLEEGVCSEGHQALTHSLPTAICGGTSRPADPACGWRTRTGDLGMGSQH